MPLRGYRNSTVGWTRGLARHPFAASYVLALAARLALVSVYVGHAADTATYKAAAAAFRSSPLTADDGFLRLPPLFTAYLAIVPNDTVAFVLQIAIVSLIAPVVGVATGRHFGRTAGILAALVAALEPNFIFWSTYLLTDSLAIFFFALALERTSSAMKSGSLQAAFAAGIALGLRWLTRAAYSLVAVAIAVFSALVPDRRIARGVLRGLGLLLVLAVPTGRNLIVTGEPILYRTTPWQGLWAGTMWNETGRGTIGVDIHFPDGFSTLPLVDQEAFAREAAQRFIADSPSRFALLTMKKVLWFWLPAYPEWSLFHRLWSWAYFLVFYGLAVVGLIRVRRSPFGWLLVVSVLGLLIPVALTIVDYDGRYRLPAELCLVPLAAAGAAPFVDRILEVVARRRVDDRIPV